MQNIRKLLIGKLLMLFFLAGVGLTQASEQYQKGIDAFARGDYETAANAWLVEAYEGSVDAQFNLGVMYLEGKGVAKNREDAIFWFTKSAEGGHTQSQYNLGHLYFEDQDDTESLAKGVAWWRQASLQGFGVAQYNYARALFYGVGVERNIEESKRWMDKSAASGEDIAVRFIEAHVDAFTPSNSSDEILSQSDEKEESNVLGETSSSLKEFKEVEESIEIEDLLESTEISPAEMKESTTAEGEGSYGLRHVKIQNSDSLVYSKFNAFSSVVDKTDIGTLLRVVSTADDWIEVYRPGGFLGWVQKSSVVAQGNLVKVVVELGDLYASPVKDNQGDILGQVGLGQRLLMLEETDLWFKIVIPENISGWVEAKNVVNASETEAELALIWQQQRIQRRTGRSSADALELVMSKADSSQANLEPNSKVKLATQKQTSDESLAVSSPEEAEESDQGDGSEIESFTVDEFVGQ